MKKLTRIIGFILMLGFVQCKTKQKAVESPSGSEATAIAGKTAGEIQMEIAAARWPGTVAEELKAGQITFTTKCTSCHQPYKIEGFSEKKWLHEIDDMSPRAKLSAEEKLKLTKYVLTYRETKEKLKTNAN
jgi:mono/diheme cytochrome c family protein